MYDFDIDTQPLVDAIRRDNLARFGDAFSSNAWAFVCGVLASHIKYGVSAQNVQRDLDQLTARYVEDTNNYLAEKGA